MQKPPGSPSMGLRYGLLAGAACVLLLAVAGSLALRWSAPSPQLSGVTALPAPELPSPAKTPPGVQAARPPPPRTAAPPRPPARQEPARQEVVLPSPTLEEGESPLPPPKDEVRDRFEPQEGQEPELRTLVAVGDIRIAVNRSAEVRDEAGLRQVLVRIGGDLERRFRELQGGDELGPQQVLDTYREELGKYMSGDVELRGPGWMIGTEVGPPLPREKWWKPRPQ